MVSPISVRTLKLAICSAVLASPGLKAQDASTVALRVAEQTIKPGDRIDLKFLRDVELNATVSVNERGEAVFPKIGTIDVDAIRIGRLRDTLATRYAEFLRNADLEVAVLRRVVVNGEVKVPDVYYLDANSSVRDAIARAGGMLETANKSKVMIVRNGRQLKASRWQSNLGPENDLLSGDQIVVHRLQWLVLNALPVISTSVIVIGLIRSIRN